MNLYRAGVQTGLIVVGQEPKRSLPSEFFVATAASVTAGIVLFLIFKSTKTAQK